MSIDRLMPGRPRRRLLLSAIACCTLLLLIPAGSAAEEDGTLEGQLDWGQTYRITAPVAGKIQSIEVGPGEHVDQDTTLFRLDTRRVEADLRAAQARSIACSWNWTRPTGRSKRRRTCTTRP